MTAAQPRGQQSDRQETSSPWIPGISGLYRHIGHILRRLRLAHTRKSQRQTAMACGISTSAYRPLEERGSITLIALERVAAHFETQHLPYRPTQHASTTLATELRFHSSSRTWRMTSQIGQGRNHDRLVTPHLDREIPITMMVRLLQKPLTCPHASP